MSRNIGIWIDHKEAVIVSLNGNEESVEILESDAEKPPRKEGGAPGRSVWGPQDVAATDKRDRQYRHHLDEYYEEVIEKLGGADAIFIFGPGEAKGELKKHLDETHILRDRIAGVETADKMTQPQITSRVREFYTEKR